MNGIIYNGVVVTSTEQFEGYVVFDRGIITEVGQGEYRGGTEGEGIDAQGGYILAGVIDDQVHFRDPGLTHKGDIATESRAAAAGGVTSFMDMPNTAPQTTNEEEWERKMERAAEVSHVNYAFYMGATNDNIKTIANVNPRVIPGVKVFMGSSTGGMLVDESKTLEAIFEQCPVLVATHCEDEATIRANMQKYGENPTIFDHPLIRSEEACYRSSSMAAEIASKYNTRLHILHLTTARELSIFEPRPVTQKRITAEVCVHHLLLCDEDYAQRGNYIKCNPAIKTAADRDALREGLKSGRIDIVATDHAPHTVEEKEQQYSKAPSGMPMVQHSLCAMLELFEPQQVTRFMSEQVAQCFGIEKRGTLAKGNYADITIVERKDNTVTKQGLLYKCGWSPIEGMTLGHKVTHTFVNGVLAYKHGEIIEHRAARPLRF